MAEPSLPEESLFAQVLEIVSATERAAFLDRACAGNPALRAGVEALLHADARSGDLLDLPDQPVATVEYRGESPGTVIGPYKLLETIGEGGFGVVYVVEQTQPVRRKVALKVLKPGMDTRQVVARFEAERQALALMDHPNIARVFDGGTAPSGRPYFVMELVKGVPITQYCDQNRLSVEHRLELFVHVCEAVQHAHQKGIIHRDLKPSNVLVSRHDTTPVAKVIDFGVAKALGQELTDKTLFTGVAQMIGTPLYMSPEQAGMSDLDVDTRSDVYSLGVLLYELLTGTTPFEKERFKTVGYDEIRRIIREEEPPKPSTRLSTLAQAGSTLAEARRADPRRLSKLFRGELDWVVMKALEKDRTRRYATAAEFAADVNRYLADEPVLACPPSAGYRLRKFARRNRRALVTSGLLALALIVSVGAIAGSVGWAARERAAQRARTAGEVAQFLQRAEALYDDNKLPEARAEVEQARGVLEAGLGDEDLHRRVRQWISDLATVEALYDLRLQADDLKGWDRQAADYARVFRDHGIDVESLSTEEAAARVSASRIKPDLLPGLSLWIWVVRHEELRRRVTAVAVAADSDPWKARVRAANTAKDGRALRELADETDVTRTRTHYLVSLGDSLLRAGDAEGAVTFLRTAQRHRPGDFLINTALARSLSKLQPPAREEELAFRRVALAARPRSAWAHNSVAGSLKDLGRLDEAATEYREAIRLQPQNAVFLNNLGAVLNRQRKFDEAVAHFREAISLDPKDAYLHHNLGLAIIDQCNLGSEGGYNISRQTIEQIPYFAAAQPRLAEAVECFRNALAFDPRDASTLTGLGRALRLQANLEEAATTLRRAVELFPAEAESWYHLALVHRDLRQHEKAIADFAKAIELQPNREDAWWHRHAAYRDHGKLDQSVAEYTTAVERTPGNAAAWYYRGRAFSDLKQYDRAIADYSKAIELRPDYRLALCARGGVYEKHQGQYEKALADYSKVIEFGPKPGEPCYSWAWRDRIRIHEARKQWDKATADMAKAAELGLRQYENRLAWLLATCPDPKFWDGPRAVAIANKLVDANRTSGAVWNTLGVAHYRAGDHPAAEAALRKSMELRKGGDSFDWFFLAAALWKQGNHREAREWYDNAVEWMTKNKPDDEDLGRFRTEAAAVLGTAAGGVDVAPPPREKK